jgi:hypothetical protein
MTYRDTATITTTKASITAATKVLDHLEISLRRTGFITTQSANAQVTAERNGSTMIQQRYKTIPVRTMSSHTPGGSAGESASRILP